MGASSPSAVPQHISVVSTRYDGRPRDEHGAELFDVTDEYIRIVVPRGTPITIAGVFVEQEPSGTTQVFMRHSYYNVNHISAVVSPYRNLWYANIAIPPVLDGDVLRWTDLYLDVMCDVDRGILLKDVEEFDEMVRRLPIPPSLVERAYAARDEVMTLAAAHSFPFDREVQLAAQRG